MTGNTNPSPEMHVVGRWRAFEDTTPGYWGIELEDAGNDDDAIMSPIKIHRDTVARIVDAHNTLLVQATVYKPRSVGVSVLADNPILQTNSVDQPDLTLLLLSKADAIRKQYQLAHGRPCDCSTPDGALHYGRAQGLEIAADIAGHNPSPQPNLAGEEDVATLEEAYQRRGERIDELLSENLSQLEEINVLKSSLNYLVIKPLKWTGPTQKALIAEPLPGFKYTILDDERGVDWSVSSDEIGWNPVDSVDEAKAACQANFEALLLGFIMSEVSYAQ